jgi:hypothetical protein
MEMNQNDKGKIKGIWQVEKFASEADFKAKKSYYKSGPLENLLLNEGINELLTLAAGTGATKWDASNAFLGVGDDNTAASAAQTGLIAATNKVYVAMDGSYPTYGTSQQVVFRATFDGSTGNFHWQEFTVSNSNSNSGKNLNRLVSDQGTKTTGQVWQLTLTITIS